MATMCNCDHWHWYLLLVCSLPGSSSPVCSGGSAMLLRVRGCPVCFRYVLVTADRRAFIVSVHCDTQALTLTALTPRHGPGASVLYSGSSLLELSQLEQEVTVHTSPTHWHRPGPADATSTITTTPLPLPVPVSLLLRLWLHSSTSACQ
jgi:hypothetical protein